MGNEAVRHAEKELCVDKTNGKEERNTRSRTSASVCVCVCRSAHADASTERKKSTNTVRRVRVRECQKRSDNTIMQNAVETHRQTRQ